ncbi:MAG: hypothetical protein AB1665_01025 [Candidatus Thermoplasmatota archaeon]
MDEGLGFMHLVYLILAVVVLILSLRTLLFFGDMISARGMIFLAARRIPPLLSVVIWGAGIPMVIASALALLAITYFQERALYIAGGMLFTFAFLSLAYALVKISRMLAWGD